MAITLNGTTGVTTTGLTSNGIDDNATSTAMTLDTSGNLLVGKTVANTTTLGNTVYAGIVSATMSGDPAIFANRAQDGSIIELQKSGSSVGSIGIESGGLTIDGEAGHAGLRFGGADISPRDGGVDADNAIQLGSTVNRFTDLYLSGGVYLGGTGAANKLDDYEEGTWVPSFGGSSANPTVTYSSLRGTYVKTGGMVIAHFKLQWTAWSADGSGYTVIYGLPFASKPSSGWYTGSISETGNGLVWGSGYTQVSCEVVNGGTTLTITRMGSQVDQAVFSPTVAVWSSGDYLNGVVMYPV